MTMRTRSRPGARYAFGTVLAGLLLAGAGTRLALGDEALGPLPWRVAGKLGFTVDAAAFPDSAGRTLDVYVRVPPATLADLVRDASGERHLKLTARLRAGGKTRERSQEIAFAPADSVAGLGKVVVLKFPTWAGRQRLRVQLEDPSSSRRGLLYLGRKVSESSQVNGEFAIDPDRPREMSDIEFAWAERQSTSPGPFQRSGHTVIPNPERLYGRYAEQLHAFFVARDTEGDTRPWHWRARMLGSDSTQVATAAGEGAAASTLDGVVSFNVADRPAGGYDLEVQTWQEGDSLPPMVRRAHFSIAWKPRTWFRNPRDVEDDVHFLLSADEADSFSLLQPGEQERYLEDFWKRRDPTPGTEANEARDAFYARIRTANERYSRAGIGPGMFSDMGRVYIRYGEPSEVLHQVIPTGDDTVSQMLEELSLTEDRPLGDVHQKGLGGDQRPFEVWIYEGEIPLPLSVDPSEDRSLRRRRIVFLFVDEHGVGDFRLRYSSE